jgi:hypothetical protein
MRDELRLRSGAKAFNALTLGVAFYFVAYALVKAVEDITDDSYEGLAHLVIGGLALGAALLPALRGGAPYLWLGVLGLVAIVVGLIDLFPSNVPWHVPVLIGAGMWIAQQRRFGDTRAG